MMADALVVDLKGVKVKKADEIGEGEIEFSDLMRQLRLYISGREHTHDMNKLKKVE